MNREEYIAALERALVGKLDPDEMRDIIQYYQNYIYTEIAKGKQENEVLSGLGEPRLLAKSIVAAHGTSDDRQERESDETGQIIITNIWDLIRRKPILILYALIAILVFFGICALLLSIIGALLPVILIGIGCWLIYRFVVKRKW